MSSSNSKAVDLEKKVLALQQEVEELRKKNTDLDARLTAYSSVSLGQTSLINKLIDKVPFGVMLLNKDSIVIQANNAAGKIFDCAISEITGQHCSQFFECFNECDNCPTLIAENKEIGLRPVKCVNNKYVMHSAFVSDEGSEKIVVETFIDITEIKQAEAELIKVSNTKDEFLGMISHELRTPLNVIQGYSSLLEEELRNIANVDVSLYVENITQSGEILLQVVNNLLELSNLTSGKVQADNIPIEMEMIVAQLQYRLEKTFENNHNTFSIHAEKIKPFEQDLALLMKILYELLINANKFTENGEVTLTISLQKKDSADWLRFVISDTGCGMTKNTMEQIFNAFHQADSSLTRAYEGLGLGLSIVEKMVRIINGYIDVESEVGKGSSFAIYLPYHPFN